MKTFIHLVSVLILSIVLFACSNAHFLKEEGLSESSNQRL